MYAWIALPLVAGCLLLTLVVRPALAADTRAVDFSIGGIVIAAMLQLVPLPAALAAPFSPSRPSFHEALRLGPLPGWIPISISPRHTAYAVLLFGAVALTYVSARRVFESGGLRTVCRGIGWMGLALACVAIAQRGAFRGRIYGFWTPIDAGAMPYGPFVNRNHCATWLVMSIPLCFGYLMARLRTNEGSPGRHGPAWRHAIDGRTLWLALAGTTMVLALALSLSRSGIAAFGASAVATMVLARSRLDPVKSVWLAAVALLAAVAVAMLADVGAVLNRFAEALEAGRRGRLAIWTDTWTIVRDFWMTGTGVGTYETAMLVYQTGDRAYYYNQAHNDFLQVAAEGGLLVGMPGALALGALASLGRRRLAHDSSGIFWIRAGAAAGLAGAAAQSVWETGLRIPANALLAAVLAAILTHRPRSAVPAEPASDTPATPAWP